MATASGQEGNWKAIPTPFGINATYGGGNGTIPENEIAGSNKASWNKGFPDLTFQPNNAPSGGDFNTFNNIISGLLMNIQLGQAVNVYDATYQTAQGGYPQGALIWANETSGDYTTRALFMSLVDNNLTVPSTANTATWKKLLPVEQRNYLPDFSRIEDLYDKAVPYLFTQDGWLYFNFYGSQYHKTNGYLDWGCFGITSNGTTAYRLNTALARGTDYTSTNTLTCMVSAGDILNWFDWNGNAMSGTLHLLPASSIYFIPFKS